MIDGFEPLDVRPAYRQIADAIERKITAQSLKAGEQLPSEFHLAKAFGVNRSTVREAVRELEGHGLLARTPGQKALRVAPIGNKRLSSGMSRALVLQGATFLDLWETMMALEPAAAELAARRRTAGDLAELRRAASVFIDARADTAVIAEAIVHFFAAVAAASQNCVLSLLQASINALLPPLLTRMLATLPQSEKRIATAQSALVASIASQDAEGSRLWMERHVRDFRRGFELAGIPLEYVPASGTPRAASSVKPASERVRPRAPRRSGSLRKRKETSR